MAGKAVIDALAQGTPPEQESKWQKIAKYLINDSIPAQAVKSAWSGFTFPGDVLAGKADPYDYGRALDFAGGVTLGSAAIPAKAGEMRMGAKLIGAADDAADDATKAGIRAFHGSPHDFDKFDISKIGTGEGSQAYGNGLYFADNIDVAKSYQPRNLDAEELMLKAYNKAMKTDDYMKAEAWERAMMHDTPHELRSYAMDPENAMDAAYKKAYSSVADELDKMPRSGGLYEVNINATADDFLDWDAPLSQQPKSIQDALSKIDPDLYSPLGADYDPSELGQSIYYRLKDMGIEKIPESKGIRYFDSGSRSSANGTRNYVIFDPSIVAIVKKYGIAGALAAGLITQQQADEFWAQGT